MVIYYLLPPCFTKLYQRLSLLLPPANPLSNCRFRQTRRRRIVNLDDTVAPRWSNYYSFDRGRVE